MQNAYFHITIDERTGYITAIQMQNDPHAMNWCAEDGAWGRIHGRELTCQSCTIVEEYAECTYQDKSITVQVRRHFADNGNFVERYTLTNTSPTVLCINRDNFGIEFPFSDRYTYAEECMVRRCHTHIWCGHDTTWINALRMGDSDENVGMFLTRGAFDCYEQNGCRSNTRGIFVLCPTSFFLKSGESYTWEWELFPHRGKADFRKKCLAYERYIDIRAEHYTVFAGEPIRLTVICQGEPTVQCCGKNLPLTWDGGAYKLTYTPTEVGEYKFIVTANGQTTWAEVLVKVPFDTLLERRVRFLIEHQQCRDPESPLYGAFLVYDNDYDSMYFDYANPDHNACRERMNIPLLLLKYLQLHDDPAVRQAMALYSDFVLREFYDTETGEVFNTIGKNRDQLRLYNAPGVMLVFAEMYFVTKDPAYLSHIVKLAENYYSIGGKKCYANGLAIGKVMRAFRMAGREAEGERVLALFHTHVDNIIANGTAYPKHEVNYEQTIVTPAVTHIAEMGLLCEDRRDYYIDAVHCHLACLERFSGTQPSYHLHEIAIRYWDDYWFGKNRTFGDTLPHHLSCLTARAYIAYSRLTGDKTYLSMAEECIRNCMALIRDDGRGAAAHVYPYRLDGKRGEFYDPWSNDQDLVLYDALYLNDVQPTF